jgi:hypothetical protein
MDRELCLQPSEEGAGAERLAALTGYLRPELLQLDVEDVTKLQSGDPPGSGVHGVATVRALWSAKVSSKGLSQKFQAVRRHRLIEACLIAIALVCVLASCAGAGGAPGTGSPGTGSPGTGGGSGGGNGGGNGGGVTPPPTDGTNPFRQFDQDVAGLVQRQAIWQVPKRLIVQSTARVGLVIGDAKALRTQIRELVPGTYPKAAGQVKVGSTIGVQLLADPGDASVTPKDAIDESTGEHTALLWTWFVRATHPNSNLFLTADIVVKMSDGHVLSTELPLSIPVSRTWQYTLGQIFTNWATWVSIVTVLSGALAWTWRKRKRRLQPSSAPTSA